MSELALKMQYMGACALLARISNRPDLSSDDRASIKAALDDCIRVMPSLCLVNTGRGWSLEQKA